MKRGILIKPETIEDSEVVQVALHRKGLFFTKELDIIHVGESGQPLKMQQKQIDEIVFTSGVIAHVEIVE